MGELILEGLAWVLSEMWVSRSRLWRLVAVLLILGLVGLLVLSAFS